MTKQRDIFKGRVKRLLKDQKDMGQVGEPAVQSCVDHSRLCANLRTVVLALCAKKVAAIEAFVHDLGKKLKAQAELQGENTAITPVELKQVVMAHPEFAFLQEKVANIDESHAKYHKSHAKKKKTTTAAAITVVKPAKKRTAAAASTNGAKEKKATKKTPTRAKKAKMTAAGAAEEAAAEEAADKAAVAVAVVLPSSVKMTQEVEIEEDDDYDESDSE